ncbi:MAG: group II intron reverse transcriptase/maturase, partial [Planctomycetes bacterium]|nr:group II intron reverse transcriptase/maturase [Planctomycetota bacterium]
LATALLNVVRNKGAPGVDGRSVEEVLGSARSLLPRLHRALLEGTYQPGDIRRVWIPKPGGGQRGLGIPNVIDRWVQQAVVQVLEPVFEPTFHSSSHGFRPKRGAHTAIAEAKEYVGGGYGVVVDIDLSKFFDRVHHHRLLGRLGQKVADSRILKLIGLMLKAKVVMPDGTRVSTEEGTPQGGPPSPLLSNVVLDEFDKELARRRLHFVRYADDCNIFVRSERAGQRVMGSIRKFLQSRLRLLVNEEKSKVARPEEIHFLGFRLRKAKERTKVEVLVSNRTKERMDAKIRELTPRMWGQSPTRCIEQINVYLRGWSGYFRICTEEDVYLLHVWDAHIRRRLRAILVRQKKRPRHLYRHLQHRGASSRAATHTAWCRRGTWYRSNTSGMTAAYRNAWFHERLVSLVSTWEELNPRPKLASVLASGQTLLFDL